MADSGSLNEKLFGMVDPLNQQSVVNSIHVKETNILIVGAGISDWLKRHV